MTYEKLHKLNIKLSATYKESWGRKPGKYIGYRYGYITDKYKRGIFFSADKKGAKSYGKEVKKYLIEIKNPFVIKNQHYLIRRLNNSQLNKIYEKKDKGDNIMWLRNLDAAITRKMIKMKYDSITYIYPMPPATREMCVFNKNQIYKI